VPGGNLSVSGGTAVAVVVASGQCSRHCLLIMSACSNLAASRQATRVQGSVTTGARAIAARTWLNQAANSFGSRLSASSQSCAAQRARARFSSRFSSRIQCGSHNSRHAHIPLPTHPANKPVHHAAESSTQGFGSNIHAQPSTYLARRTAALRAAQPCPPAHHDGRGVQAVGGGDVAARGRLHAQLLLHNRAVQAGHRRLRRRRPA